MTGDASNMPDPQGVALRARELFERRFDRRPVVAHAPGRVNLIGEHVDYLDGIVLPMAIDRRAAVAVAESTDGRTTIAAPDLGIEASWNGPPPAEPVSEEKQRFANHLLGVVAARGGHDRPLALLVTSEIPAGAGVSSSAAIEVATGAALNLLRENRTGDPSALARDARQAEHDFVGTPCGIMDMLVSAAGRRNFALRIDCRTLEFTSIRLPGPDRLAFLLVDSGVVHRLSDGGYAARRAACERVATRLGRGLRDASIEDLAPIDEPDRSRARHVVEEIARVDRVVALLTAGDLEGVGEILLEGHASLRDRFEVSVPELDTIVDTAARLRSEGCYGARMTGGGFGGSAIVLAAPDRVDHVLRAIEKDFRSRFGETPESMQVHSSDGVLALGRT